MTRHGIEPSAYQQNVDHRVEEPDQEDSTPGSVPKNSCLVSWWSENFFQNESRIIVTNIHS